MQTIVSIHHWPSARAACVLHWLSLLTVGLHSCMYYCQPLYIVASFREVQDLPYSIRTMPSCIVHILTSYPGCLWEKWPGTHTSNNYLVVVMWHLLYAKNSTASSQMELDLREPWHWLMFWEWTIAWKNWSNYQITIYKWKGGILVWWELLST